MKKTTFLLLFCFLIGCAETKEVGNEPTPSISTPQTTQKTISALENAATIKHQENVIEVHQEFRVENGKGEWLGAIQSLELKDISFVRMSAFSLDQETDYRLHFRIYGNDQWGEWMRLPESQEQLNPQRKVFDGLNLFQDIARIQFKSNHATQSPVVFRLFVAYNQN